MTVTLFRHAIDLHRQGLLAEAELAYLDVVRVEPANADAWCYLGIAQVQRGLHDTAALSLAEAIRLRPAYAEAYCNLGTVFLQQSRLDQAVECYETAVRIKPALVDAHSNLGKALCELCRFEEAEASCRRALELAPQKAEAWLNLGVACRYLGRLDEAVAHSQKAVALQPQSPDAHLNLGLAWFGQGKAQEAVASFEEALRLRPGFPDAIWGRGLAYLLTGDFERGWRDYEWRWHCKPFPPRKFAQPAWDGTPAPGKTILLYAEQGLGDTLQFIRYAPLVKQRAGQVFLHCQEGLIPLLQSCTGIDRLISDSGPPPPFDVTAALLSLPAIFGTTLSTVPADVPYLRPDPRLVAEWSRELDLLAGMKIGIAWQGSPKYALDRTRSIPLAKFAPLAAVPGVTLISLQQGPGVNQVLEAPFPIVNLTSRLDQTTGMFMDTAAIMQSLDLVVTSDSAVAHLAGALAVRTWLALPFMPDFRWMLGRDDSPWYPTMRLFRQPAAGDWESVFDRVASKLTRLAPGQGQGNIRKP